MRSKILFLGLIFLTLIVCKKGIENPYSRPTPTPEPQPQANVVFAAVIVSCGWDVYDICWLDIYGAIKNEGNADAEAIKIHAKLVNSEGTTLRSFSYVFVHPDYEYSYLKAGEQKKFRHAWGGISREHYYAFDETNSKNAAYITWENVD